MWWMALIGAAVGQTSYLFDIDRKQKEIERQKGLAQKAYNYQKDFADSTFNLQKTEALDQLAVQRNTLDTQLGLSVDNYNTSLLGQAFGIQDARIQTNSATGESLVAEGMSGTRGNTANETVRAYVSQSLERNIEVQDKQNKNYLNQMITGANMSSDAIEREKISWMPGGYRQRAKDLSDAYAKNMFGLRMEEYDHAYKEAGFDWLDFMTAGFSGASSGMSLGNSIDNYNYYNKDAWNNVGKGDSPEPEWPYGDKLPTIHR